MPIDWNDISARFQLVNQVGLQRYEDLLADHARRVTVATVGDHAIRVIHSERFGRMFVVGNTGRMYAKRRLAQAYARKHPIR